MKLAREKWREAEDIGENSLVTTSTDVQERLNEPNLECRSPKIEMLKVAFHTMERTHLAVT